MISNYDYFDYFKQTLKTEAGAIENVIHGNNKEVNALKASQVEFNFTSWFH